MTSLLERFIMCKPIEAGTGGHLVLVTGASGKIGKHVVRELLQRGFKVRAITSRPRADRRAVEGLEWRVRDFTASIDFGIGASG